VSNKRGTAKEDIQLNSGERHFGENLRRKCRHRTTRRRRYYSKTFHRVFGKRLDKRGPGGVVITLKARCFKTGPRNGRDRGAFGFPNDGKKTPEILLGGVEKTKTKRRYAPRKKERGGDG